MYTNSNVELNSEDIDIDFSEISSEDEVTIQNIIEKNLDEITLYNIAKTLGISFPPVVEIDHLIQRMILLITRLQTDNNAFSSIVDGLGTEVELKWCLLIIVKGSAFGLKSTPDIEKIASRAISILNAARVSFSGMDLSNVSIPGADLSYGIFHSTQLKNANLNQCYMRGIWLNEADITEAQTVDINFDVFPTLKIMRRIESCCYSPDGRWLAVGCTNNNNVYIYDTESYKLEHIFKGHRDDVISLDFSPTGKYLASGSDDSTIRIWSLADRKCLSILQGHEAGIKEVVFSLDGLYLASCGDDQIVNLWLVKDWKLKRTFADHKDYAACVSFSPDSQYLASGGGDGLIYIWSIANLRLSFTLQGHTIGSYSDAHSEEGFRLDYSSDGVHFNQRIHGQMSNDGGFGIFSLDFSPDGVHLVSGGIDGRVIIWSLKERKIEHICESRKACKTILYTPDNRYIISGHGGNTICLRSPINGEILNVLNGHRGLVTSLALNPIDQTLFSGSYDMTIRRWKLNNMKPEPNLRNVGYMSFLGFVSKGQLMIYRKENLSSRSILTGQLDSDCLISIEDNNKILGFNSNGSYMVSSNDINHQATLWTTTDDGKYKPKCILPKPPVPISNVTFSLDNQYVAASNKDIAYLWSIDDGSLKQVFSGHQGLLERIHSLEFSHNSQLLALGSFGALGKEGGIILLRSVSDGSLFRLFGKQKESVRRIVFSQDGKHFASCGTLDRTVYLWTLEDTNIEYIGQDKKFVLGRPKKLLEGHTCYVNDVVFSPDGRYLASSGKDTSTGEDNTLRLWSVKTGECLKILKGFTGWVSKIWWNQISEKSFLVVESLGSLYGWQITEDESGTLHCILRWVTAHTALAAYGLKFDQKQFDLSNYNLLLEYTNSQDDSFLGVTLKEPILKSLDELPILRVDKNKPIKCIACSSGGKWLAAGINNEVYIWEYGDSTIKYILKGHTGVINSLHFNSNDQLLASGSSDNTIIFWKIQGSEFKLSDVLRGHEDSVLTVNFSPLNGFLASGSQDNTIRYWRVANRRLGHIMSTYTEKVTALQFSSSGQLLVSVDNSGNMCIWRGGIVLNQSSSDPLFHVQIDDAHFRCVCFSPNEEMIVAGDDEGMIIFWNFNEDEVDKKFSVISGNNKPINSLKFNADGSILIYAEDKTIKYRLIKEGISGLIPLINTQPISDIQFKSNDVIAVASLDGNIYFYKFNNELLIRLGVSNDYSNLEDEELKMAIELSMQSQRSPLESNLDASSSIVALLPDQMEDSEEEAELKAAIELSMQSQRNPLESNLDASSSTIALLSDQIGDSEEEAELKAAIELSMQSQENQLEPSLVTPSSMTDNPSTTISLMLSGGPSAMSSGNVANLDQHETVRQSNHGISKKT